MSTLYLIEQNTVLRKTGDRLLLCKKRPPGRAWGGVRQDDILLELPCADIDQVMIFGNVQVTTQALHKLLQHEIELSFFSFSGKLLGQLTPPRQKNIHLRIAQFARYHEPEFCLRFSKAIVCSKISGALRILHNHLANHTGLYSRTELQKLKSYLAQAERAGNLDELRGYEGSSTAHYFSLLGRAFISPWRFQARTRRPPADPVNAVLSYGYVVVTAELQSLLDGRGFDPYLGFYHQLRYGRPGLALDLVEEFRHPLIDRLALTLFNKNILCQDDFYRPAHGGVYLSISGKRKFFEHYERMLGKFHSATDSQAPTGFRRHFQQQVAALARTVTAGAPYHPLRQ